MKSLLAKVGKRIMRIVLGFIALVVVFMLIGAVLHATYFKKKFGLIKPYGELVSVFDGKMHVYAQGNGEETIVLLPGMGVALPSADFGPLSRRLGERYTVVVVEYFGVGFSSETKLPRTSEQYVEEIRMALTSAGFKAPYILMAHSISSIFSEYYAAKYPQEVKAIISLDGTSSAYYAKNPAILGSLLSVAKLQQGSGLMSLLAPLVTNKKKLLSYGYSEKELGDMILYAGFSLNDTLLEQIRESAEFIGQVQKTEYPQTIPYLKIIARDTYEKPNKQLPFSPKEYQEMHLARLGDAAEYTILDGNHFIYLTNVDQIAHLTDDFLAREGEIGMQEEPFFENSFSAMNTQMTYRLFGPAAQDAGSACEAEITRLEKLLSRYERGSDISRINGNAGLGPIPIHADTVSVLSKALEFAKATKGLFSPTLGPLIDLWDWKHAQASPDMEAIANLMPYVLQKDLRIGLEPPFASLRLKGESLDLGGIAKGYAAQKCVQILEAKGVVSAFLNLGGNVSVIGEKQDGMPWKVGIQHPRIANDLIGSLDVADASVVTSGDYQRYFLDSKGKRWHHIIDPRTGHPAESGLVSVTVVSRDATFSDALSTALFVAGPKDGMEILDRFPDMGVVMVDEDFHVWVTKNLEVKLRTKLHTRITVL